MADEDRVIAFLKDEYQRAVNVGNFEMMHRLRNALPAFCHSTIFGDLDYSDVYSSCCVPNTDCISCCYE